MYESFRDLQGQKQGQSQEEKENTKSQQRNHKGATSNNHETHTFEGKGLLKQKGPSPTTEKANAKKKVSFAVLPHEDTRSLDSKGSQADNVIELTEDGSFDVSSATKSTSTMEELPSAATSDDDQEAGKKISREEAIEVDGESDAPEIVELPPPRECMQSEIRFTPRVFPTPSRESKAAEEEDWLLKNRKHINKHQGLNRTSEYDISETDRTSLAQHCSWKTTACLQCALTSCFYNC